MFKIRVQTQEKASKVKHFQKQSGMYLINVETSALPKYSDTLTLSQPGADYAHHICCVLPTYRWTKSCHCTCNQQD